MQNDNSIVVHNQAENLAPAPPASGFVTATFEHSKTYPLHVMDARFQFPDGREFVGHAYKGHILSIAHSNPKLWEWDGEPITVQLAENDLPKLRLDECRPKRERRVAVRTGRAAWIPRKCCYFYHDNLTDAARLVLEYALRVTSGNGDFYGSVMNTAVLLGLSRVTVQRAIKQLLKEGHFKLPADPEDRRAASGAFNYTVLNHEQYVKERSDAYCLTGDLGAKTRAILMGLKVEERDE